MREKSPNRRSFLKSVTALSAIALPTASHSEQGHASHPLQSAQAKTAAPQLQTQERVYLFLTQPEVAFVEAAISRLIPADELWPGAKEAGVAYFIDHELAGAWGSHARNYRAGPWPEGTAQQGYQSPLAPRELYRTAIQETDRYCVAQYGKTFAALADAQQEDVLQALQAGKITLDLVPSRLFFAMLWANTQEGFFADPMYGGNRDKIGWKLVGFPGVAAVYTDFVEKHNVPYLAVPVSIADIQQNLTRLDEHGHPVHVLLTRRD